MRKKTAEETPQCTCFYKVHFASGDIKEIPISDFDPTTLNRRVVISYDGRYVFSTNYHKGIKQIDIDTGKVLWKYPIKHMFALWATEKSLLCLHKEYCPELMRISLESKESVEKIRVEGGWIVPIQLGCILCKGTRKKFYFINPNALSERIEIPQKDLCGFEDDAFEISEAKFENGKIYAKYIKSNPDRRGFLLHCEEYLNTTSSALESLKGCLKKEEDYLYVFERGR